MTFFFFFVIIVTYLFTFKSFVVFFSNLWIQFCGTHTKFIKDSIKPLFSSSEIKKIMSMKRSTNCRQFSMAFSLLTSTYLWFSFLCYFKHTSNAVIVNILWINVNKCTSLKKNKKILQWIFNSPMFFFVYSC